ncbi:beta-lactamase family protein [Rhizobiaceae bacterium n13]|uniref:Beta-lactamase family protein n=1 Tax=Ferirhizobium litorale TaxID=2927786 RepID=A0AAE3U1V3_9HYPH|nr:serine hydrolase [Fererhizobium litorale]MDI7865157.1 beta-lactamase family protein [Fererhizobium litorale]MDI7922871.1 beta-lactamase family protein [Fererhizobium litorale]
MHRRTALGCLAALALAPWARAASPRDVRLQTILDDAGTLSSLETVLVSLNGDRIAERAYRGNSLSQPTNIKSASKSVISAMVGIAIEKGMLDGPDQRVAPILKTDLPVSPDPRLSEVTIGNLLSMQAGLQRMSGPNYGRWVSTGNWVRSALAAPFIDEPGGGMLYSTASTHLLSAILTRVGGKSTLALAREWFDPLVGFSIAAWERDPQGIYLGGNQMAMTPRSLLAFGELYTRGGLTNRGVQLVSADWIARSWTPRTNSIFTGDAYGYGWFLRSIGGVQVRYGWGYGGQMLYVVPSLGLTVVMTSDENNPSARTGYRDRLHGILGEIVTAVRTSG